MTPTLNHFYSVEPLWFMKIKNIVHSMFLEVLVSPMAEVRTAANLLYAECGCSLLEYKGEAYSFATGSQPKKRVSLYEEHPSAEIIHNNWNTFKEPMLMAQQCYAIATFHGCTEEFLSMEKLDIPQHQWKTVEKFYNEFHALHAIVAVRGLNE